MLAVNQSDPEKMTPQTYLAALAQLFRQVGGLGLVFTAPDPANPDARKVLIASNRAWQAEAEVLAARRLADCSAGNGPAASVRVLTDLSEDEHLEAWCAHGVMSIAAVSHALPGGKSIEAYIPACRRLDSAHLAHIANVLLANWSGLKNHVFLPLSGITPQQSKVLACALEGLSVKETAMAMGLTERTVNHHLSMLQVKLNSNSKTHSIAKAIWLGAL